MDTLAIALEKGEVLLERLLQRRRFACARVRHLAAQLAKHPGAVAVRLAVEPAGCSGFGYRIDHADEIRADDRVFESAGLRIAVDPLSLPYVQGTTIDLVQECLARKLRFDNPNVRQSCGCGESFGT